MCFEIDNKGIDWHASDLRLDLIMGNSGYTQASKEMKIETVRLGTRY